MVDVDAFVEHFLIPGVLYSMRAAQVVGLAGCVIVGEGGHCCKKANREGDGSLARPKVSWRVNFAA
jgi:hypothetical protein